ncbi:hypothetical protein C8Q76DRAFT_228649 [Earliella scabrosa]|nr:hypothetical protein C8Q76DRAFT_228649 [Earliella scabrosa]
MSSRAFVSSAAGRRPITSETSDVHDCVFPTSRSESASYHQRCLAYMVCLVVVAARLPRFVSLVRPNIIFIPVPSTFFPRVARHGPQRERARPRRGCGWAVNSCLMHRCRLSVLADRLLRIGGRRRRRSCCPWQRLCAVLGRPAALVGRAPAQALICRRPIRGTIVSFVDHARSRLRGRSLACSGHSLFGSRPCQPPPYVYISSSSPTPSPHRTPRPSSHSRHRTPSPDSLTPFCMLSHLFHPTRPP